MELGKVIIMEYEVIWFTGTLPIGHPLINRLMVAADNAGIGLSYRCEDNQ